MLVYNFQTPSSPTSLFSHNKHTHADFNLLFQGQFIVNLKLFLPSCLFLMFLDQAPHMLWKRYTHDLESSPSLSFGPISLLPSWMWASSSPGEQFPCPYFNTTKWDTKSPEPTIRKPLVWFPIFTDVVDIVLTQTRLDYIQVALLQLTCILNLSTGVKMSALPQTESKRLSNNWFMTGCLSLCVAISSWLGVTIAPRPKKWNSI